MKRATSRFVQSGRVRGAFDSGVVSGVQLFCDLDLCIGTAIEMSTKRPSCNAPARLGASMSTVSLRLECGKAIERRVTFPD
jgi:hypothetical protein